MTRDKNAVPAQSKKLKYHFYRNRVCTLVGRGRCKDTDLVVPETVRRFGVTYQVEGVAAGAFRGDTIMTSLRLPDTVSMIGESAFEGCTSLNEIKLHHVRHIYPSAFAQCTALHSINLGRDLRIISAYAFHGCSSLANISSLCTPKIMDRDAFTGCALTNVPIEYFDLNPEAFDPNVIPKRPSRAATGSRLSRDEEFDPEYGYIRNYGNGNYL